MALKIVGVVDRGAHRQGALSCSGWFGTFLALGSSHHLMRVLCSVVLA
jgi:hypothetical protein